MRWPCWITYTDLLPDGVGGLAHGPRVLIRPWYRDDLGIVHHELEHVRQWWVAGLVVASLIVLALIAAVRFGGLDEGLAVRIGAFWPVAFMSHSLAYRFIRRYRIWAEVKAYREQMCYPDNQGGCLSAQGAAARLMSPRYRTGLSYTQALSYFSYFN